MSGKENETRIESGNFPYCVKHDECFDNYYNNDKVLFLLIKMNCLVKWLQKYH